MLNIVQDSALLESIGAQAEVVRTNNFVLHAVEALTQLERNV
jgi:hypothetical protein